MRNYLSAFHISLMLIFLVASCSPAVPAPTSIPTQTPVPVTPTMEQPLLLKADELAQFEDYASTAMQLAEIPGMSVAIVENGKVVYARGFGVRELGKDEPVTADTRMMIGSVSKPLTSIMMASVVDDGLMQWDTPALSILPAFALADVELTKKLTMQDLICACTGVAAKESYSILSRADRAEGMISHLQYDKPVAPFGEKFIYNNTLFASGGYLAGLAAGGPKDDLDAGYMSAMQERVFDPAGMRQTTLSLDIVQSSGDFALPHGKTLQHHYLPMPLSSENSLLGMKPAGGIWSTANDMSRLLLTILDQGVAPNGQRIVSTENLERIWQPGVSLGSEEGSGSYALGWFIDAFQGRRIISHPGNTLGFSAELALIPADEIGIVIITNAEGAGIFTDALLYRFLELAYDQPSRHNVQFMSKLQASKQVYSNMAMRLHPGFNAQTMAPFVGSFSNSEIGTITVQAEDEKLMLYSEGLTAELRQWIGAEEMVLYISDIPQVTIPALNFSFRLDAGGKPMIALYEDDVLEPYIFEKLDLP